MKWKTLADRRLLADTTKTWSAAPGPAAYDVIESDFGKHGNADQHDDKQKTGAAARVEAAVAAHVLN